MKFNGKKCSQGHEICSKTVAIGPGWRGKRSMKCDHGNGKVALYLNCGVCNTTVMIPAKTWRRKKLAPSSIEKKDLSHEEELRLQCYLLCERETSDLKEAAFLSFIEIYLITGMRRSELLEIKFSDIDLINRNLYLKNPCKGSNRRAIELPEELISRLKRLQFQKGLEDTDKIIELYMPDDLTRGSKNTTLSMGWRKLRFKIWGGSMKLGLHCFRHTVATRLQKKVPLQAIQKFLGHKSIKSTERYTHDNFKEEVDIALDQLNKERENKAYEIIKYFDHINSTRRLRS